MNQDYTVLLLRPDYVAENYGTDTFLTFVTAPTVKEAQVLAQREALEADASPDERADSIDYSSADDYAVLMVLKGTHVDIRESML
jgi:hypothetical protein